MLARATRLAAPRATRLAAPTSRLAARSPVLRAISTTSFDHQSFTDKWVAAVDDVPTATDPAQSASILRRLTKTKLLKYTDMKDAPEKFFLAHRLLSTVGLGGFGVRFTVQFNLFAGERRDSSSRGWLSHPAAAVARYVMR